MDYNHIKNYLDKIRNTLFSKEENIKIISEIINKNIAVKIETKFIQIKGSDIYIKASPLVRSEILIKKRQILEDLSLLMPNNNFKDIK